MLLLLLEASRVLQWHRDTGTAPPTDGPGWAQSTLSCISPQHAKDALLPSKSPWESFQIFGTYLRVSAGEDACVCMGEAEALMLQERERDKVGGDGAGTGIFPDLSF